MKKDEGMNKDECQYVEYDAHDEGYCKASVKGGPLDCPSADYRAKSYYPPCNKHWIKGKEESENIRNYNQNFRGK
jgi:hypothetical protein